MNDMATSPETSARPLLARLRGFHDLVMAGALTAAGWIQIATLPLFIVHRRPPAMPGQAPPANTLLGGAIQVESPTPWMYVLIALGFLPLAYRRRFPLWVLAITTVIAASYDQLFRAPALVTVAPLIALYTVGTLRGRRTTWTAATLAFVFTAVLMWPEVDVSRVITEIVRVGATFAVAAALGDATRNRRAYVAEVEERAAEAERTREQEARRRVEEERLRIAREIHDVTAHSLSIIAVQAGAAEKVVERDPAAARRALEAIRLTSRDSLDELRAMLGVMRGAEETAPLSPEGRLEGLPQLVAAVEDAGVAVSLETAGDLIDLPAYADVSAFRIVQEALTNVVRHASATGVTVRLRRESDAVYVTVTDDGRTPPATFIEGHGITGMRERAAALGGTFEAGRLPDGGFHVSACLPLSGRGTTR